MADIIWNVLIKPLYLQNQTTRFLPLIIRDTDKETNRQTIHHEVFNDSQIHIGHCCHRSIHM